MSRYQIWSAVLRRFPGVPSPTLDLYLYLAEPACFWFDCTHLLWITIKSFLLSFDTPQESLLLTTASHPPPLPSHPHLSQTGTPPLSPILTLPLSLSFLPHLDSQGFSRAVVLKNCLCCFLDQSRFNLNTNPVTVHCSVSRTWLKVAHFKSIEQI